MINSIEDIELEIWWLNGGADNMVREDDIECCVCYENHWGVKLPNCDHFICAIH